MARCTKPTWNKGMQWMGAVYLGKVKQFDRGILQLRRQRREKTARTIVATYKSVRTFLKALEFY